MSFSAQWDPFAEPRGLASAAVAGVVLKPGDRVRLRPRGRADIFDMVLDGRIATIRSIEQDLEDRIHLAVTVDDDPGSDLGTMRQIGHRFFFGLDEVEPWGGDGEAQ